MFALGIIWSIRLGGILVTKSMTEKEMKKTTRTLSLRKLISNTADNVNFLWTIFLNYVWFAIICKFFGGYWGRWEHLGWFETICKNQNYFGRFRAVYNDIRPFRDWRNLGRFWTFQKCFQKKPSEWFEAKCKYRNYVWRFRAVYDDFIWFLD